VHVSVDTCWCNHDFVVLLPMLQTSLLGQMGATTDGAPRLVYLCVTRRHPPLVLVTIGHHSDCSELENISS
jgi:hypothetical protein